LSSERRVGSGTHVWAFVVAVIGAAAFAALLFALTPISEISAFAIGVFLVSFAIGVIPTALFAAVFGLPLTWLLAKLRMERWWTYAIAGFVVGALVSAAPDLLVSIQLGGGLSIGDSISRWALAGISGAAAGLIWWWMARRPASMLLKDQAS
jgi:hypothetical protein